MDTVHLFNCLLVQCLVQIELIHTIDNIVFYPSTTRKEDADLLASATNVLSPHRQSEGQCGSEVNQPSRAVIGSIFGCFFLATEPADPGMYQHMSTENLLQMVDCLWRSHHFARQFNTNAGQRNVLWKAGFRGPVRPNLFKQETQVSFIVFFFHGVVGWLMLGARFYAGRV